MATKLLSEQETRENYVSSSESDGEGTAGDQIPSTVVPPCSDGLPQTGPKGVLTDFYRNQEIKRREEVLEENKRRALIEKHAMTAKSQANQAKEGENYDEKAIVNLAKAFEEGALDKDPFITEYRAKRMHEMKQQAKKRQRFGHLIELRGDKYATAIDGAPKETYVVIHIYDELLSECQEVNKSLTKLAKLYPTVKFCRVQSFQLGVSESFAQNGLPALLVYKGGDMLGNLVRVTDTLGKSFTEEDMESYLHEKNCLPPESEKEDQTHLLQGSSISAGAKKVLGHKNAASSDSDD